MKSERRIQLYIILLIAVVCVGSALIYITLKDWNTSRIEPRTFEGIVSDMKSSGAGRYFWDIIVVNGTESKVFKLEKSLIFKPVFGKFNQEYQAIDIGDSVTFTYHMSIFWENLVDEVTVIGELE